MKTMPVLVSSILLSLAFSFPAPAENTPSPLEQMPGDHILGKPDAKITLIGYESLSCTNSANFHNDILPEIQRNYIDTGKVRVIFRDFPINEQATAGAQLVHCAAQQGGDKKYFESLNVLFANRSKWAFDKDFRGKALEILQGIGLDRAALENCMNSDKTIKKYVRDSLETGQKLQINSTPAFFLNGKKIGLPSPEAAARTFDALSGGK